MVSHPENGSDSPIGSNRDRGRDTILQKYTPDPTRGGLGRACG